MLSRRPGSGGGGATAIARNGVPPTTAATRRRCRRTAWGGAVGLAALLASKPRCANVRAAQVARACHARERASPRYSRARAGRATSEHAMEPRGAHL
eukprot:3866148-Alexandrium_andersonii.AAC.1